MVLEIDGETVLVDGETIEFAPAENPGEICIGGDPDLDATPPGEEIAIEIDPTVWRHRGQFYKDSPSWAGGSRDYNNAGANGGLTQFVFGNTTPNFPDEPFSEIPTGFVPPSPFYPLSNSHAGTPINRLPREEDVWLFFSAIGAGDGVFTGQDISIWAVYDRIGPGLGYTYSGPTVPGTGICELPNSEPKSISLEQVFALPCWQPCSAFGTYRKVIQL